MSEERKRILISTTPSTNTLARELAGELPHLSVVRTDNQTSGRGQRGNSWEAEPGMNLTLSYLLRPVNFKAQDQFRINEGVALAVVDTLADFGIEARIKWPNDIYVGNKKICGILIEHSVMGSMLLHSVAGIGLNVNQREFVSDAPNPVSMLQLTGKEIDLDEVEKILTENLTRRLRFVSEGEEIEQTETRHQEFKRLQWRGDGNFHQFEDLRAVGNPRKFEGRIADILPEGLLRIEECDGHKSDYGFKEIRYILPLKGEEGERDREGNNFETYSFMDTDEIIRKDINVVKEDKEKKVDGKGSSLLSLAVRYLLPLALTVLLVWYMFSKVNFSTMLGILRDGVDYWWILCAMGISVFSHIFRAARWRLQLRGLDIYPPFMALCCSIFGCYALNLVFPRLGEVWRCTYIAGRQKAPFTTVLGSMVADRLADTLTVLLLLLLTFVVANSAITSFMTKYSIGRGIVDLLNNPYFWIAAVGAVAAVWGMLYIFRDKKGVKKLIEWIHQLWEGFVVVARMKGKWMFLFYTLCIWGCYFFQLYVAFFAFDFTRELCTESSLAWGLTPCLVAFVLSSIGMAIPSNGGLGPWNIAVMFGLAIYGISDSQGTAFSMLQWSGQTVMLIILGIYTMAYISFGRQKRSQLR